MGGYLFLAVVYLAGYSALFLGAACLACGLYFAAELAEEHTTLSGKILKYTIIVVLSLHLLLWLDGLQFEHCFVGFLCNLSYLYLMVEFPFFELSSPKFIVASVCMFINHVVWFRFFTIAWHPVMETLGFFFLMVWLVPLGFLITLSVNDSVLPSEFYGAGGDAGASASTFASTPLAPSLGKASKKVGFKEVALMIKEGLEDFLPVSLYKQK